MLMITRKLLTALMLLAVMELPSFAQVSATFYSDGLIGRPMANGEPYRSKAYTAAHPTIPLGRFVLVTNLSNGRQVQVKITDRCNCGIDLSKAAFEAIGNTQKGRVRVSIKRL